ncbi:hypothetical protein [Desulfococcus sp.]|uniref:hypothetical protein n=1 Tax=Desulfococcus sp. TaxID=2025834 RepID=UPI0035933387
MIETLRKTSGPVLLLDCGGVFGYTPRDAEKKANAALESMTLMGYHGMNLGGSDFTLGTEYLRKAPAGTSFPFISTNAAVSGVAIPRLKRYEIIPVGGVKVAVLGILPVNALKWAEPFENLSDVAIADPEAALKAILPEIEKEKADITILLSQLDFEPTQALLDKFPWINAAVSCGMKSGCDDDHGGPEFHAADSSVRMEPAVKGPGGAPIEKTAADTPEKREAGVLYIGSKGKHLGVLPMTVAPRGRVTMGKETRIELDDDTRDDAKIFDIVNQVYYVKPGGKNPQEDAKTHQELMEGLKKSPEEFMDQYRKTHKDAVQIPAGIFQQKGSAGAAPEKGKTP